MNAAGPVESMAPARSTRSVGSSLWRALAAETVKLRTLPATPLAIAATALLAALIAGALAWQAVESGRGTELARPGSAAEAIAGALPFVQAGVLVLGVLSVSHEYAGRQLCTTLVAVPARGLVVAAKTVMVALFALLTASLAVAVAWVAVRVAVRAAAVDGAALEPFAEAEGARIAGAVLYLVLMGLFAHAVALLLRGAVPALATALALVLLVSPLLAGFTDLARWLPDRAAFALYLPAQALAPNAPGPVPGAVVAVAWVLALLVAGTWRFNLSAP